MVKDLRTESREILWANRRVKDGFQYTVPSPTSYPFQWLWDSCFHAIVLTRFEPEDAKKELTSLVARQMENGMIPHMIYWERPTDAANARLAIAWGRDGTSSITQPPMLAYAAWRIWERDQDAAFLSGIYPNLFHYYKYLLHERDPHERHLIGLINPDESGEDDSPRFDQLLDLPPIHEPRENFKRRLALIEENRKCHFDAPFCMKNFFWVKDVPFNAILVENLRCLGHIAEKIGRGYDAAFFDNEAGRVAGAMRALMLEDGLFWSTHGEHYAKIKTKTWAIFAPLFAKLYTPEEARDVVERYLLNEREFATPFPVPTVSRGEPSYDPEGFWRGRTWLAPNWFIFHGLRAYGFTAEAEALRARSRELLERSGFREHFNPETGEGGGAENFTWGTLVLDMETI